MGKKQNKHVNSSVTALSSLLEAKLFNPTSYATTLGSNADLISFGTKNDSTTTTNPDNFVDANKNDRKKQDSTVNKNDSTTINTGSSTTAQKNDLNKNDPASSTNNMPSSLEVTKTDVIINKNESTTMASGSSFEAKNTENFN